VNEVKPTDYRGPINCRLETATD